MQRSGTTFNVRSRGLSANKMIVLRTSRWQPSLVGNSFYVRAQLAAWTAMHCVGRRRWRPSGDWHALPNEWDWTGWTRRPCSLRTDKNKDVSCQTNGSKQLVLNHCTLPPSSVGWHKFFVNTAVLFNTQKGSIDLFEQPLFKIALQWAVYSVELSLQENWWLEVAE